MNKWVWGAAAWMALPLWADDYSTRNFHVTASTYEVARQVATHAEDWYRKHNLEWIGRETPRLSSPVEMNVEATFGNGAGATSFVFHQGEVFSFRSTVKGTLKTLLEDVIPHEVLHVVNAVHFRQALPRWADEGMCSTVESSPEQERLRQRLVGFLQTGRGIAFNPMFAMFEYPADLLPLYAQGHSVAEYLLGLKGKRAFVNFLHEGMGTRAWNEAVRAHYGLKDLSDLQISWLADFKKRRGLR